MCRVIIAFFTVFAIQIAYSRPYAFKQLRQKTESSGGGMMFQRKLVHYVYSVRIGTPAKSDSREPFEIRAATLHKHSTSKKVVVNDVTTFGPFPPPEKAAETFVVTSAPAYKVIDQGKFEFGNDLTSGWSSAGVIIEIWQDGKCVKHWSSSQSQLAKIHLPPRDDVPMREHPEYKTVISQEAEVSKSLQK